MRGPGEGGPLKYPVEILQNLVFFILLENANRVQNLWFGSARTVIFFCPFRQKKDLPTAELENTTLFTNVELSCVFAASMDWTLRKTPCQMAMPAVLESIAPSLPLCIKGNCTLLHVFSPIADRFCASLRKTHFCGDCRDTVVALGAPKGAFSNSSGSDFVSVTADGCCLCR